MRVVNTRFWEILPTEKSGIKNRVLRYNYHPLDFPSLLPCHSESFLVATVVQMPRVSLNSFPPCSSADLE